MEWTRDRAVDRLETLVETVATERMPVPVREIWVTGDIALGLDPVDRIDVYLTKDILLKEDPEAARTFTQEYDIDGVGKTVDADWAQEYPTSLATDSRGYAAPAKCLAAHLTDSTEPIHLEVCNASFEDNVTQRLEGAMARENYAELLDPRGVCLWIDGNRSPTAFERLRTGDFAFPPLPQALEMLGLDHEQAQQAADVMERQRTERVGTTVREDVLR